MNKDIEKFVIILAVATLSLIAASHPVLVAAKPPAQGGVLPPFDLVTPEDSAARAYLGLSGGERFTIPQIKARVVIIQLFSMY